MVNVTVSNGETVEMGQPAAERLVDRVRRLRLQRHEPQRRQGPRRERRPNFTLTLRKRDNSLMDRGQNTATTDANGYYSFEAATRSASGPVMEAYSDSFYTTGVTYQADNQTDPDHLKGAGVDVSTLNIIGLGGTVDWGVHAYDPTGANGVDPRNGGIVGTVSYDTTRNELDPQYAAAEDWQPGVSGVPVDLYATVDCGTHPGAPCDADGRYELDSDGSYSKGKLLNTYVSENWERPDRLHRARRRRRAAGARRRRGCAAHLTRRPTASASRPSCRSIQFGPTRPTRARRTPTSAPPSTATTASATAASTATSTRPTRRSPTAPAAHSSPLGAGDYLVESGDPDDASGNPIVQGHRRGRHQHRQRRPVRPAGPAAGVRRCAAHRRPRRRQAPTATRRRRRRHQRRPCRCDRARLHPGRQRDLPRHRRLAVRGQPRAALRHQAGRAQQRQVRRADVQRVHRRPAPSRLRGLIIDDVNFSADPKSTAYGEKAGVPFVPVGIYDFTNRLVTRSSPTTTASTTC